MARCQRSPPLAIAADVEAPLGEQFCGAAPTFGAAIASDLHGDMGIVATLGGQRYVAKLSGATGDTLWEVTTPGTSGPHYGQSIGVDSTGDLRNAVDRDVHPCGLAAQCESQRHGWIEMGAGHRSEHQDQHDENGAGGYRVAQ